MTRSSSRECSRQIRDNPVQCKKTCGWVRPSFTCHTLHVPSCGWYRCEQAHSKQLNRPSTRASSGVAKSIRATVVGVVTTTLMICRGGWEASIEVDGLAAYTFPFLQIRFLGAVGIEAAFRNRVCRSGSWRPQAAPHGATLLQVTSHAMISLMKIHVCVVTRA